MAYAHVRTVVRKTLGTEIAHAQQLKTSGIDEHGQVLCRDLTRNMCSGKKGANMKVQASCGRPRDGIGETEKQMRLPDTDAAVMHVGSDAEGSVRCTNHDTAGGFVVAAYIFGRMGSYHPSLNQRHAHESIRERFGSLQNMFSSFLFLVR